MIRILFTTIIVSSLFITRTYSQNFFSALHHDQSEEITNVVPYEVTEQNIFHNSSGKEIEKRIKRLNSKKKVLTENRFGQDGKLKARLTNTYDTSGLHCLTRKFERWTNIGNSLEIAYYEYDADWNLIKVTDKTEQGTTIQESIITNNEKGQPIKLELFNGNGNLYGIENAIYDDEANKAYTEVLDSRGNIISRDTLTINFKARSDANEKYNEKGDLIESPKYFYEYEYDEYDNWTTKKIFKNAQGKWKKDRVFKRKFKYNN